MQQGGCGGRIASVEALGEVAGACGMKVREEVVDSVLEIAGGDRVANVRLSAATACGVVAKGLDDGNVKRSFFLNRPYQALYVKPGIWRDLDDFSSGAVCMVLASEVYQPEDYIRDYNEFLEFRKV